MAGDDGGVDEAEVGADLEVKDPEEAVKARK